MKIVHIVFVNGDNIELEMPEDYNVNIPDVVRELRKTTRFLYLEDAKIWGFGSRGKQTFLFSLDNIRYITVREAESPC